MVLTKILSLIFYFALNEIITIYNVASNLFQQSRCLALFPIYFSNGVDLAYFDATTNNVFGVCTFLVKMAVRFRQMYGAQIFGFVFPRNGT